MRLKWKMSAGIMAALFLVACVRVTIQAAGGLPVDVWLTTGDEKTKLVQQTAVEFTSGSSGQSLRIGVDDRIHFQTMEGFGAALTQSSGHVIRQLMSPTQQDGVLRMLFSRQEGIGISYLRLPMGGSDYVVQAPYSYDDRPAGQIDPELTYFSIAVDEADVIPVLKEAQALNPDLKLMGSPWSPPAWMKSPETLKGGSLRTEFHLAYAHYFVKFIEAYQAHNLPIHTITIQNEPYNSTADYPSAWMDTPQQTVFVRDFLGPAFQKRGIGTKILIWDHNWDRPSYPITVLNDAGACPFISGSAWHCYNGNPGNQSQVHDAYPDKDIYFTECSGGDWAPNFASNLVWNFQNLVIGATRNWAKTILFWNLALDSNHGPHVGGCNDCRGIVTVSRTNGDATFEVEYYVLGHVSKFVDPGALRIESDSMPGVLETVAFLNPDGSKVMVVLNPVGEAKSFEVNWRATQFSYSLPGQSVATFIWTDPRQIPGEEYRQRINSRPGRSRF
jgi:glucosylceramidase